MTPLELTRLEKAAADCGFELDPELVDERLVLRSAQFPEFIFVQSLGNDNFELQASAPMLLHYSGAEAEPVTVLGWNSLYESLDKAATIARTMPNRVAQRFHQATATLPKSTEVERLVVQRIGQNLFRGALLDYWQGRCCVTGLAVPELLRASHTKPWAQCDSDEERLDVFNGFLLAPHLDALFDGGWITFDQEGSIVVANIFPKNALAVLGLSVDFRVEKLMPAHQKYLNFHRTEVFRGLEC
jgi:putative restriction endonuclease